MPQTRFEAVTGYEASLLTALHLHLRVHGVIRWVVAAVLAAAECHTPQSSGTAEQKTCLTSRETSRCFQDIRYFMASNTQGKEVPPLASY